MKELEITQEQLQSTMVLHVAGSVDSNTASELQAVLLRTIEVPTGGVELDLSKVSFMSSAGLRALLLGSKALQKRCERLRLSNVPPQIYNILNLTGFTSFMDVKT